MLQCQSHLCEFILILINKVISNLRPPLVYSLKSEQKFLFSGIGNTLEKFFSRYCETLSRYSKNSEKISGFLKISKLREHSLKYQKKNGIGNGIGYSIDMPDTRNKQQSKMTLNNDMDVDINGTKRIAIKRKMPDDGLKGFKLYYTAQVCNKTKKRRLMKSHLKMCGRKICKFDENSCVQIRQRLSLLKELKSATSRYPEKY
ncbi:hypothetical protein RFI_30526 [Reticulomyxa filosa]|uniref:Uncharacterized protein n=1 Tax=Reticulomyxa filosa TaxID=46433 RepID=X6LY93_RETFI|nr:hypothetical protein RFI_30526 [Reticulomyxa filosa]|eukprot:ETO06863.1 hypothetical protein RFI_30526 [Reticulomyxa filosa]